MENLEIKKIIETNLDPDILRSLKESFIDENFGDRSIYETWGGRAITAYNTIKEIYKLVK